MDLDAVALARIDPARPGLELVRPGAPLVLAGEGMPGALALAIGPAGAADLPDRPADGFAWILLNEVAAWADDPLGLLRGAEARLAQDGVLLLRLREAPATSLTRCARAEDWLRAHLEPTPRGTPWRLSPWGTRLLVEELAGLGLTGLREAGARLRDGTLLVALRPAGGGCPVSRPTLRRLAALELGAG